MRVFISSVRRGLEQERYSLPGLLTAIGHEPSRFDQADLLLSTLARYIEGIDGTLSLLVRFGDSETIELSLALDDLAEENLAPAVVPDPMTVIRLAGYLGRYDCQEEKFLAAPAA